MKKSWSRLMVSVAAVAALGLPIAVLAEATEEQIDRFVNMYDFNKDGMVSRSELMSRSSDMIDKMAKDKNGMLNDKATRALLLELQKGDGVPSNYMISKADLMKKIGDMFDKLDAAKKGMLDRKQAEAFFNELMKSGN